MQTERQRETDRSIAVMVMVTEHDEAARSGVSTN
jgi:hypothetical protein